MESTTLQPTRILIPLDGSLLSSSALRVGFAIAERAQLPVTLLHVHDGNDHGDQHLTSALERFADVAPCDLVLAQGRAADAILDQAQRLGALVCMASHGRTGLGRLALGSVAEEVVRRNTAGTLVVGPSGAGFALSRERAAALFCTDGSERAASAAPLTTGLVQLLGLSMTIVQHVAPDEDVALDGGLPPRPLFNAAQENCEMLKRYFAGHQLAAETRVLFGETTRSIVHAAESVPATLIALASHGRTGFDRFALGSTAAAIVQKAACPVFVVGPAAGPGQPVPVRSGSPAA